MTCTFSQELLALYIEGDLPDEQTEKVNRHVMECSQCEQFCHELEESQAQFKSLLRRQPVETVNSAALTNVRRSVMSKISSFPVRSGWMVNLQRVVLLAGIAVVAMLSVSMLAQMGAFKTAAVFEDNNILRVPDGYRQWVFVGSSKGIHYDAGHEEAFSNAYIDPASYRKYAETGKFPEGTVMVLEKADAETKNEPALQGSYEKQFAALEVSVKDSRRFDGGWGYFRFTDGSGKTAAKAQALPDASGCRACHQDRAETDHVFTQFYPVLRSAVAKSWGLAVIYSRTGF